MSIRAHRINNLEIGKVSFSITNDDEFNKYLDKEIDFDSFYNSSIVEIPVETIQIFINEHKNIEPYLLESLKEDIIFARDKKNDYLLYYCF